MLNVLQGPSDDQVALIGCLVALICSAGLMYVSYFVGPVARKQSRAKHVTKLPVRPAAETPRERAA